MGKRERVEDFFRKQLRKERERLGWSQADLAEKLSKAGVPMIHTTIAKIEGGDRAVRVDEAAGIAEALDVPLDWMLGRQTTGPAAEMRYALRKLQETAQDTITDLNAMLQALNDWDTDTFPLAFDGKEEIDADIKEVAEVVAHTQRRLLKITLIDIPDDDPIWRVDIEKFREAITRVNESIPPLKRVSPEFFNKSIQAKEADDEAQS